MTHFLDDRTRSPLCRSPERVRWRWTIAFAFVTCRRCREQILALGVSTADELRRALERLAEPLGVAAPGNKNK